MNTYARLSKHFSLYEFLVSQTAARQGIDMTPSAQVIANLTRLCAHILQPLRYKLDRPVIITSGYRPPALNEAIGGSDNSQHICGLAADIVVPELPALEVYHIIRDSDLPYDQVIDEFGRWTHVSINAAHKLPREMDLIARRVDGKVRYAVAK